MLQSAGVYFVPIILTVTAVVILFSSKDLFSEFLKGASYGLETCVKMIPILVILITAVNMFSASGAMKIICGMFSKLISNTGFPEEIVPLMFIRPLSGSAATATANKLFLEYGPDSFAGRCASIIMGASDTIVYTLALYFGSVGVVKTRHAYPVAILTLIFCGMFSVFLANVYF